MVPPGNGLAVWLAGYPGAGKSTLARLLAAQLRAEGHATICLDGDELLKRLAPDLDFVSFEQKEAMIRRLSYVAKLAVDGGAIVLIPFIAPGRSAREAARSEIGRFVEVFLDCPLELCMQRDPSGRYAAAKAEGRVLGGANTFQPPDKPDIVVKTGEGDTPYQSATRILDALRNLGYVAAATAG